MSELRRLTVQECTRLAMGVETAVVLEHELRALEVELASAKALLQRLVSMGGTTRRVSPTMDALRQDARAYLHRTREEVPG